MSRAGRATVAWPGASAALTYLRLCGGHPVSVGVFGDDGSAGVAEFGGVSLVVPDGSFDAIVEPAGFGVHLVGVDLDPLAGLEDRPGRESVVLPHVVGAEYPSGDVRGRRAAVDDLDVLVGLGVLHAALVADGGDVHVRHAGTSEHGDDVRTVGAVLRTHELPDDHPALFEPADENGVLGAVDDHRLRGAEGGQVD